MRVCEISRRAGKYIERESVNFNIDDAKQKGIHDFVSYVDLKTEEQLVDELGKLLPEAGFLTEEGTSSKDSEEYLWIIDPLDGTTNFMHGLSPYSISIALSKENDILLGVILNPANNEIFYAFRDGGAWLNGERIMVSQSHDLSSSLIATGFPTSNYSRLAGLMQCIEYLIRNTHGVRRMGSAAIDLAYVACGRIDGFFEYGLNKWDVAAGIIIVREAGGEISSFSGDKSDINGSEVLASNQNIHDELISRVSVFMNEKEKN